MADKYYFFFYSYNKSVLGNMEQKNVQANADARVQTCNAIISGEDNYFSLLKQLKDSLL